MRRIRERGSLSRHGLIGFACLLVAVPAAPLWLSSKVAGQGGPSAPVAQPVLGTPGGPKVFVGASPAEAAGETWAISESGPPRVSRYTAAGGWDVLPAPPAPGGGPLEFFVGPQVGRATPAGGLALAATATGPSSQQLVVRDPGGPLRLAAGPGAALAAGEALYGSGGVPPLIAPFDGPGASTHVFAVPYPAGNGPQQAVLNFDGDAWAREPICVPSAGAGPPDNPCPAGSEPPSGAFRVLAIDARSASETWILVRTGSAADGIVLFSRDASAPEPYWQRRQLLGPLGQVYGQRTPTVDGTTVLIEPRTAGPDAAPRPQGQLLTATDGGVWVDVRIVAGGAHDATVFYRAQGAIDGTVEASWCDVAVPAGLCTSPLGAALPTGPGRSFAWSGGGPYGQRVITGIGQGAVLSLQGEGFAYVPMVGGAVGTQQGAAFAAPDEGWLGSRDVPVHYTSSPQPNRVQRWPVPFRRPLTAIVAQPGAPVGATGSQALAVGDRGQVARYVPGEGWTPEFLLSASSARATPRLRGVAWPQPDRAHAVGDDSEMWLWRSQTGLWEPDPAKPPNLAFAHFMGIAFDPADPDRGYAVGKHGVLLRYDREWTQEALPAGVEDVHFTSIAFAGRQALAGYKKLVLGPGNNPIYEGGLLVNDGAGWRVDESVSEVVDRVAGLPDGGAAIATGGSASVRDSVAAPWRPTPEGATGASISALAAIREGGSVRAVLSVNPDGRGDGSEVDSDQIYGQPPPGQAPLVTAPYPLPTAGHILRETATGWRDEQHEAFPPPPPTAGSGSGVFDWPRRPDAVLALLLDEDGSQGWAVGGETGEITTFANDKEAIQTSSVMRYPADGPPPGVSTSAPVPLDAGKATFAIGGNARCAAACADLSNVGVGPEPALANAVGRAAAISGVRAFVHTGPGVTDGVAGSLAPSAFARESAAYARRLGSAAGGLPVFATPASADRDGAGSLATFAGAFAGFGAPLGGGSPGTGVSPRTPLSPTRGNYSFDSDGAGGVVRVIVLDQSSGTVDGAQRCWLASELATARAESAPAIVVGNRDLSVANGTAANLDTSAADVARIVVTGTTPGCTPPGPGGASAYFFNHPEQNRAYALSSQGRSIPSFGSGTLGYVAPPRSGRTDFVGASGFMLAEVDVSRRDSATNVAPVEVRLIPSIAELALDATDGTLLRRSQPALFEGLARRPLAGMRASDPNTLTFIPDPYVPVPTFCRGTVCASALQPEYRFESSNPDIADFVRSDPASPNPRSVLLGVNDKPIVDASSGLLCAFNAGATTVKVIAGGLSYSQRITVQKGSVQRPCGTTPLRNQPRRPGEDPEVPPPPPPQPAQPALEGGSSPLPPPPAPAAVATPPAVPPTPSPVPLPLPYLFIPPLAGVTQVPVSVPPPAPSAARPTPPSGTSSANVYQNAVAPQRQREVEQAIDLVHHMSAARGDERAPLIPAYVPALVLMLAYGGSAIRRSRGSRRRNLAYVQSNRPRERRRSTR